MVKSLSFYAQFNMGYLMSKIHFDTYFFKWKYVIIINHIHTQLNFHREMENIHQNVCSLESNFEQIF